jgi:SAM-dependent methyltransferase
MHPQAYDWIREHATADPVTVLDIGGRNINGSPRPLFPNAVSYTVLDILDSDGVDIVADAATWEPADRYDVIVCAELFEHAADWRAICRTAYKACKPGGRLIVTTAGPDRALHSGVDGGPMLHPGEHYGNVSADELERALLKAGWLAFLVDSQPEPADTRAVATKQTA